MSNPTIGYLACAHCGQTATVHREAKGQRRLYYRCMDDDGIGVRCGTIQPRGPEGQRWIDRNMSAPDTSQREAAAEDVADEAREYAEAETRKVEKRRRRSGIGALAANFRLPEGEEDH